MKRKPVFCLCLFVSLLCAVYLPAQRYDPKADEFAVVESGTVRFTILTPQLIRLEWSAEQRFEDHASFVFVNRKLEVPNYQVAEEGDRLIVSTDKLRLRYKTDSGRFTSENLDITIEINGEVVTWRPGLEDAGNLKGTSRTLDGYDGDTDHDGKKIDLGQGVVSRSGWALIDDSDSFLFDAGDWPWVLRRPDGERQDWYFFVHGHDYKQALRDFTLTAGRIPMPPRFAFGYWWSRYWIYSETELRKLVADMQSHGIPMDVLIIDMEWHHTYGLRGNDVKRDPFDQPLGWTGYTWNRNLFPDPERFLAWTEEQHLKTALNLHPASGVAPMEEKYEEFARELGFDTSGRDYIPYAMADKKFAETYFKVLIYPLEKMGIDFWWIDWQQWPTSRVVEGLSNTWWLNYAFFSDMERRGKRPLLFHRWGGMGNHRYQIGFSGDTIVTWESLAFQPYFTATASNVGYGYWSHDIGGHQPDGKRTDPELYLRWLQYGVFSPIVRTHSTKTSLIERRFWKFPDHFDYMKEALELRYALVPYIYTAARQAYDTGIPLCRPMYYDHSERPEAYEFSGQYMFGEDILAAPLAEPISDQDLLARKKVWLPEGTWYEWSTGTLLEGGRVVERTYSLAEIPVFFKAGAIVPMFPKVNNLQEPIDTLVLTIIPGAVSETLVYDDDGLSPGYQFGEYAFTKITSERLENGSLLLTIHPREGSYDGMPAERAYELRLPTSFPPEKVTIDGDEYSYDFKGSKGHWTYRGDRLETIIRVPKSPCDESVEIVITPRPETVGREALLDGKAGLFRRIRTVAETLKYEIASVDWAAAPPNSLSKVEQTPIRIDYNPESALAELEEFEKNFGLMIEEIRKIPDVDKEILERCIRHLGYK